MFHLHKRGVRQRLRVDLQCKLSDSNVPFTDILRADRHAVMHAVPGIDRHLGPYLCMILTPN